MHGLPANLVAPEEIQWQRKKKTRKKKPTAHWWQDTVTAEKRNTEKETISTLVACSQKTVDGHPLAPWTSAIFQAFQPCDFRGSTFTREGGVGGG
jgi:hypothetical protein